MKADPNAYQRPARKVVGRVLTDTSIPGLELDLSSCRTLGTMEITACLADAQQVYADHYTGYGLPGQKGRVEPEFLIQSGEIVVFGLPAAQVACVLFRAQSVPDADRYTPQELIRFMALSDALVTQMDDLSEACANQQEAKPDPLAPNGSGGDSSPSPATTT